MIIEGGSRSGARWFAAHLARTDQGQQVSIAQVRGLAGDTIPGWFRQMEAMALGTRGENYFYHANINPREDEHLSEEQWDKAVDTLERNLGLEGQSRFIVEHEKNGRTHRHVFWSRVDPDDNKVIRDSHNYDIHMRTADQLEKLFAHERTPRGRGPDGPNPKNRDVFRGKKSGIDPYDVKAELTALWRQSDTGRAFAAAVEAHGFILAKGDRRDFVVIDQAGDDHSLSRRVGGVRAAEVRARMADVDREALPSVEEARMIARERRLEHEGRDDTQPDPATRPADHDPVKEIAAEFLHEAAEGFTRIEREPLEAGIAAAEGTAFDRVAQDLVRAAKDAAPVAGELAAAAALAEGARLVRDYIEPAPDAPADPAPKPPTFDQLARAARDAAPALSEFEQRARETKQALRETAGSDDLLITAGLDWLARKLGRQPQGTAATGPLTAFERAAEETKQALRDNGGQPYTTDETSFWKRSIALLAAARDQVASWVKDTWQDFVGRFTRGRDTTRDDPGLER